MNNNVLKIQKIFRGYFVRKKLISLKDEMNKQTLEKLLDNYISNYRFIQQINKNLTKKCRNQNFPSHISENICKFAICNKYKIMPTWNTKKGDLLLLNKQIEVKGFMSNGPSSFGPNENWDYIYFVDCKQFLEKQFKVYEIKLSNTSEIWKSINLTKNQTFGQIASENKRGLLRASFDKIFYPQLINYSNIIFHGHLSEL